MGSVGHPWRKQTGLGCGGSGVLWSGIVSFLLLLQPVTRFGYLAFWAVWAFWAFPWCLVHLGRASFAGHPPGVYKAENAKAEAGEVEGASTEIMEKDCVDASGETGEGHPGHLGFSTAKHE